jgi:TonB family protein
MHFVRGVLFIFVLSLAAHAQPQALTPLTFADADYPITAMIDGEKGEVGLNLTLGPDGRPTKVDITRASGSPRLDAAAAYFAQSRWRFAPGAPSAAVSVPWTPPLTAAADLVLAPPSPAPAGSVAPQPRAGAVQRPTRGLQIAPLADNPATLPVTADDYPVQALRAGDHGVVGLRFLVREDGALGEVQLAETSGSRRLDDAAPRVLRARWRASPATMSGMPTAVWRTASVSFRPITNPPPEARCYARPIMGEDAILITARQVNPTQSNNPAAEVPLAQRWIEVQPDGRISEAVLHTATGWMRLSRALIDALPSYASPQAMTCWFFDPVAVRR